MKRGDLYSFEIAVGLTRTGTIVRKDNDGITVLYKAEKNRRIRRILNKDIIKKNVIKNRG